MAQRTDDQLTLQIQLPPRKVVTSVYYDQRRLMRDLMALHNLPTVDLDPTYGEGALYPTGILPKIRADLYKPPAGGLVADCRALPLPTGSQSSVLLDPPFLGSGGGTGLMVSRYGECGSTRKVWKLYYDAIRDAARVLKRGGALIVKCQDQADRDANRFTHVKVYQYALDAGLRPVDIFLMIYHHPLASNIQGQRFARKEHTYFWLFRKPKTRGPLPAGGFLR